MNEGASRRVAIVKPDHLGDFVLSMPAICQVLGKFDADVILNSKVTSIARRLLPDASILGADFVHLGKPSADAERQAFDQFPNLYDYGMVIGLRTDQVLDSNWYRTYSRQHVFPPSGSLHESQAQMLAVSSLIGPYDVHEVFDSIQARVAKLVDNHLSQQAGKSVEPDLAQRTGPCIGFSIGSGFAGNSWSPTNWVALGQTLIEAGYNIKIFGGPREIAIARFISSSIDFGQVSGRVRVVAGEPDILSTLSMARDCKVVVASDGGTGHLCSLVAPVISLFGGSPYFKFRPLGRKSIVVSKHYACSPCIQYYTGAVNGCLGRECLDTIAPEAIAQLVESFDEFAGCDFSIDGLSVKSW